MLEGPLLDGFRRPQPVPAVDHRHFPGKFRQINRFLHRRVPAAHHIDSPVPEKGAVTGGTVGEALTYKFRLILAADGPGRGAGGDDHRPGQIFSL